MFEMVPTPKNEQENLQTPQSKQKVSNEIQTQTMDEGQRQEEITYTKIDI